VRARRVMFEPVSGSTVGRVTVWFWADAAPSPSDSFGGSWTEASEIARAAGLWCVETFEDGASVWSSVS
jgi:hypothetical protein